MDDLISRKAAIKAVEDEWANAGSEYDSLRIINDTTEALEEVPSAEKTGKWIPIEDKLGMHWLRCSECGKITPYFRIYSYCPTCGAKMEDK